MRINAPRHVDPAAVLSAYHLQGHTKRFASRADDVQEAGPLDNSRALHPDEYPYVGERPLNMRQRRGTAPTVPLHRISKIPSRISHPFLDQGRASHSPNASPPLRTLPTLRPALILPDLPPHPFPLPLSHHLIHESPL